jgi:hypothetical protein
LPLRIHVICLEYLFTPNTISSLDETEYAQRIHIIAQRETISLHQDLGSLDMGPGTLLREEIRE